MESGASSETRKASQSNQTGLTASGNKTTALGSDSEYFKVLLTKPDGRNLILYSREPIAEKIQATNPIHDPVVSTPHLRWHPFRKEWVVYATHRQNRTFLPPPEYSPLAVTRDGGDPTEMPKGKYDIAVFENLFPSLNEESHAAPDLYIPTRPGKGVCEVIVFSQDPMASLSTMSVSEIELLLHVWGDRTRELGLKDNIQYVLPFENRGVEVGVTLHHPHGQIYAYPVIPPIPQKMHESEASYFAENKKGLLEDILDQEIRLGERMVFENETTAAFVPAFARYPYEVWIAPRRRVGFLSDLTKLECHDLARALKSVLNKYDKLWNRKFPYLMVIYQAPTDGKDHPESHLRFEFYPPYRTKDKLKFLAGTEIGAGVFVNDSAPEEKAKELREVEVAID